MPDERAGHLADTAASRPKRIDMAQVRDDTGGRGIGEKTAASLLKRYPDLEAVFAGDQV